MRVGSNVLKYFTAVSYKFSLKARAFVPGKLFQIFYVDLSLLFVSDAAANKLVHSSLARIFKLV
jgi:hypothetical protein